MEIYYSKRDTEKKSYLYVKVTATDKEFYYAIKSGI